ncbi:aromatic ring-opening dioxygenase LigA [Streptomyces sp. NPDC056500]|uniref:aromatic ring-opening dioxygenase LigA n=1 Tax=Streptomyces sp. NPDC056500 TaxID=3345840 RepID=UPI0036B6E6EA
MSAARLAAVRRRLDTAPPPAVPGQLTVEAPEQGRPCEHGNPQCAALPTRPYVCGPRCDTHQPTNTRPYHRRHITDQNGTP